MLELIVAMTKYNGIGMKNGLAWKCKEELQIFREKTLNSILIMGRKTVETLPLLKNREIWCLTSNKNLDTSAFKNKVKLVSVNDVLSSLATSKPIFVAGGSKVYKLFEKYVNTCHVSIMKDEYECDTYWRPSKEWVVTEGKEYSKFVHYTYKRKHTSEYSYLNILEKVYNNSNKKVGRNGETRSLFGNTMLFNIQEGFPLITTKKMFWRGIVEELLFFLKGYTDSKYLEEKKVNIWKGNTNRGFLDNMGMTTRSEGVMGPMYGWNFRNFGGDYDESQSYDKIKENSKKLKRVSSEGFDQLKYIIDLINNKPNSRRIMMTSYNPSQAPQGVLYPCHSIILQFYVDGEYLDMNCYNRSQDLFHGVPFNIASSALLLCIICNVTNKKPRKLIINMGDSHIYAEHYTAVKEQLYRVPYLLPQVKITKDLNTVEDIEGLEYEDFLLESYHSYPAIKAKMVA